MTKITHIFKTYFPETHGGLEEAIRQIGRYATKADYQVEVVAVGKKDWERTTSDGIRTKFYQNSIVIYSNPVSISFIKYFRKICRNTDILHFHFTWPTAELLSLFFHFKKPIVVTFHCDIHKNRFLKKCYLPIIRCFLKKADVICITSRNLYESTPYLYEFKSKIQDIPLWIDEKRFVDLPDPDAGIIDFVNKARPYALFVGVLRWYKGLDVLLDAARKFVGDVVIVGKGPLLKHLNARIKKEKLLNVYLMGFQSDYNLKFLIQKSKFIILPSTTAAEAFGQILLEGLYFSKPLISTELGTGTSLVNKNGYTGFVVRPGCSESLVLAMNQMINNKKAYDNFVKSTFKHYQLNFSEGIQGKKYTKIYSDLSSFCSRKSDLE